jgi:catechol 2,3-dioxygenase-like lactoylglutathione lyase family enzyme
MDMKLEVVVVPVSDVDRAKEFYLEKMGFNLDADLEPGENFRVVHMTPPGSACSVVIGPSIPSMPPGSSQGLQLTVSDIEAARKELAGRGVDISDVKHFEAGQLVDGKIDEPYGSFAFFSDPDGNGWALQEV